MLGNRDAVANVAVKDLDVATDFYRNTLGLKPVHHEGKELVVFQSGHSSINVYRSEYAGTNKATAVTWTVDNVEDEVKALRNKGVVFEHYDMPGMTRDGDVHVGDHMKVAWFKDPMRYAAYNLLERSRVNVGADPPSRHTQLVPGPGTRKVPRCDRG